jgi:DNA-binding response OmpR family regulator
MKRIVVADQEKALCLLYEEELTEEGYDVVSVTDAEELVRAVGQGRPDLLVMDSGMDDQGVWKMLQGMRKSGYRLRVILSTPYSAANRLQEALVDDTVTKSSNLDQLKLKVRSILGDGKGTSLR